MAKHGILREIKLVLARLFETLLIWCFKSVPKNETNSFSSIPSFGPSYLSIPQALSALKIFLNGNRVTVNALEVVKGMPYLGNGCGMIRFNMLGMTNVSLSKVSTVNELLRSKENVVKSITYYFVKPWLREGLIIREKTLWRLRRKRLQPTMHPKIIESYLPIFDKNSRILVEKLRGRQGHEVDIIKMMSFLTLDVICESVMGVKVGCQENEDSVYFKSIHTLTSCTIERLYTPWYWPNWLFKMFPRGKEYYEALNYARNFTRNVIDERKQLLLSSLESDGIENKLETKKYRQSFLDLVLELHMNDDKEFPFEDVQDEVETFLFGGHDTSAQVLSWTLYLLGLDSEVQAKVHQELDDICGSDPSTSITLEDTKKLVYLECAIKEAARLYPPAPSISRVLDEDLSIDGIVIPKGTTCNIVIDQIHRDPDVYPDPERYVPERFLPNKDQLFDPYAFLTFSAGPRGCPGPKFAMLEMKTVLSNILRHFTVRTSLPRDKIVLQQIVIQTPVNPLPLVFSSR